jgi:hypothetical protein
VPVAGCLLTSEELEARISSLEEEVNEALRNVATARIDAMTALGLAVRLEEEKLAERANEAMRNSASAGIDATTALDMIDRHVNRNRR